LIDQQAVPNGVFAFRLAAEGSELYFGDVDSSKFQGDIAWASVTEQAYWVIPLFLSLAFCLYVRLDRRRLGCSFWHYRILGFDGH